MRAIERAIAKIHSLRNQIGSLETDMWRLDNANYAQAQRIATLEAEIATLRDAEAKRLARVADLTGLATDGKT